MFTGGKRARGVFVFDWEFVVGANDSRQFRGDGGDIQSLWCLNLNNSRTIQQHKSRTIYLRFGNFIFVVIGFLVVSCNLTNNVYNETTCLKKNHISGNPTNVLNSSVGNLFYFISQCTMSLIGMRFYKFYKFDFIVKIDI